MFSHFNGIRYNPWIGLISMICFSHPRVGSEDDAFTIRFFFPVIIT